MVFCNLYLHAIEHVDLKSIELHYRRSALSIMLATVSYR